MILNTPFRINPFRWAGIALFVGADGLSGVVMAQVDAGALQQNLEKQLPLPSPLALPEAQKPTSPQREGAAKAGEVRFTVNSFVLEGVKTLPEAQVQEVLKEWVGKSVN